MLRRWPVVLSGLLSSLPYSGCGARMHLQPQCSVGAYEQEEVGSVGTSLFLTYPAAHRAGTTTVATGVIRAVGGTGAVIKDMGFIFVDPLRAILPPEAGPLVAPKAFASTSGDVHLLWGVPPGGTLDDSLTPPKAAAVKYARYVNGAWVDSMTVITGTPRWDWAQTVSSEGDVWAVATPISEPTPGVSVIRMTRSGIDVDTITLSGIIPLATSTLSTAAGEIVVAMLAGPSDDEGRLAAYISIYDHTSRAFAAPKLVPNVLSHGFRFLKLLGRNSDQLQLVWAEFHGGGRDEIRRAVLRDGEWRPSASFEVEAPILGPIDAALDPCGDLHVAFAVGADRPLVQVGVWGEDLQPLGRPPREHASSNAFFAQSRDRLDLFWFSFNEGPQNVEVSLRRAVTSAK